METVRGCKWVDEIVADVPYIMNETYLKEIMVKHRYQLLTLSIFAILSTDAPRKSLWYIMSFFHINRIDFIVHGDDPCIVDGKDVYETAQKLGE